MRQNIMAVLVEADTIVRELWGLMNEEEPAWEPVYDEVRAGPPPAGVSMPPGSTPRQILTAQLRALVPAMQRLAEVMDGKYGHQTTTTRAAGRVTVVTQEHVTMGPYNVGAQIFNPMWLLGALHSWVLHNYSLSDEQWTALLHQVGHDPVPYWLRAHRDDPELVLCSMLNSVGRRLQECAERRGFVAAPGGVGRMGSLPDRAEQDDGQGGEDGGDPA